VDPTKSKQIGTGLSSAELTTLGEAPIIDHGTIPDGGLALTNEYFYEKGMVNFHTMTIPAGVKSIEIYLEDRVGNPWMYAMAMEDLGSAAPTTFVHGGAYGYHSGRETSDYGKESNHLLTFTPSDSTQSSKLSFAIMDSRTSRSIESGSYKLRVKSITTEDMVFDGGVADVEDQSSGTWSFFKVVVPESILGKEVLGWELKLKSWLLNGSSGGKKPLVYIRRDEQPLKTGAPSLNKKSDAWPSGDQWKMGSSDWTHRQYSSNGTQAYESYATTMAMGQPLEAGDYIIGVYNEGSIPVTYTLTSKAVGEGMSLSPTPLDFEGGASPDDGLLLAREVRYYSVNHGYLPLK